jgi:hypothetical protein
VRQQGQDKDDCAPTCDTTHVRHKNTFRYRARVKIAEERDCADTRLSGWPETACLLVPNLRTRANFRATKMSPPSRRRCGPRGTAQAGACPAAARHLHRSGGCFLRAQHARGPHRHATRTRASCGKPHLILPPRTCRAARYPSGADLVRLRGGSAWPPRTTMMRAADRRGQGSSHGRGASRCTLDARKVKQ